MTSYSTQIDDEESDLPEKSEKLVEVDTNIIIPHSENGDTIKRENKAKFLIVVGVSIFFISIQIMVLLAGMASVLMYSTITGLHILFLGLFQFINPRERASFDLMINGNQITSSIPLRAIILASINLVFSVAGIICMRPIRGFAEYWYFPVWNIVGTTISVMIALFTVLHLCADYFPTKYKNLNISVSFSSLPNPQVLDKNLRDLVTSLAATTTSLFPKFSNINLAEKIQVPKTLGQKALHHTTIALSMLLAAAIFSTQLLDITVSPRNRNNETLSDPACTYAREYRGPSGTKMMVLISSSVTVLLCLTLFFLTNRPSLINLILGFIFSAVVAGFYCFQTVNTMSWMIIIGTSVAPLTFSLRLGITLASPILASLLLSLAFSYLNTILLKEEHVDEKTSSSNKTTSVLVTLVAILTISVTIAALLFTTRGLTVIMQGQWNSAQPGGTDTPYYWSCYDYSGSLSYRFEENLGVFSFFQSGLSITLLTLSFLLLLSRNKICRPILLLFGLISFATTITTLFFFFTNEMSSLSSLLAFYISNGCQITLGFILGLGFTYTGSSFFVTIFSILLRIILVILALCTLLVISLVIGIINLAKLIAKTASKEKEEPKQEVNENKIQSEAWRLGMVNCIYRI